MSTLSPAKVEADWRKYIASLEPTHAAALALFHNAEKQTREVFGRGFAPAITSPRDDDDDGGSVSFAWNTAEEFFEIIVSPSHLEWYYCHRPLAMNAGSVDNELLVEIPERAREYVERLALAPRQKRVIRFDPSNSETHPPEGVRVNFLVEVRGYGPSIEGVCCGSRDAARGMWVNNARSAPIVGAECPDADVLEWSLPYTDEQKAARDEAGRNYVGEDKLLLSLIGYRTRAELTEKYGALHGDALWFWKKRRQYKSEDE